MDEGIVTFTGSKSIDSLIIEKIDNLSSEEIEELSKPVSVKYSFTYDAENNKITISAKMKNEFGQAELDTIEGVPFYNDNGEIDAVMNAEDDAILLSEMRDAGMIQNCGWVSKFIKFVAVSVVVVAAAVAVAAVIVITAIGAPAFVAAGIGAIAATTDASVAAIGLAPE